MRAMLMGEQPVNPQVIDALPPAQLEKMLEYCERMASRHEAATAASSEQAVAEDMMSQGASMADTQHIASMIGKLDHGELPDKVIVSANGFRVGPQEFKKLMVEGVVPCPTPSNISGVDTATDKSASSSAAPEPSDSATPEHDSGSDSVAPVLAQEQKQEPEDTVTAAHEVKPEDIATATHESDTPDIVAMEDIILSQSKSTERSDVIPFTYRQPANEIATSQQATKPEVSVTVPNSACSADDTLSDLFGDLDFAGLSAGQILVEGLRLGSTQGHLLLQISSGNR